MTQKQTAEILTEKLKLQALAPADIPTVLREFMQATQSTPGIIEQLKVQFKDLSAKERTIVNDNLHKLQGSVESTAAEREVEVLRGELRQLQESSQADADSTFENAKDAVTTTAAETAVRVTEFGKSVVAKGKEIAAKVEEQEPKENIFRYSTWSTAHKNMAHNTVGGLAVGAVFVGGFLFLRWLRGEGKKAKEAVKEKTSNAWFYTKLVAATAAVSVLGFFGIRAARSVIPFLKDIQTAKMELEKLRSSLGTLPQEIREQTEKRIAALDAYIQKVENKTQESSKEVMVPEKKTVSVSDGKPEAAVVEPKALEKAREQIPENAPIVAFARALILFHPSPEWEADEKTKALLLAGVLLHTENTGTQKKMADILRSPEQGGGTLAIPQAESKESTEGYQKAAAFLVRYCKEQHALHPNRFIEKELETMTLQEFLRKVAAGYAATGSIVERIREAKGDIQQAITTGTGVDIFQDESLQEEIRTAFGDDLEVKEILGILLALGQQNINGALSSDQLDKRVRKICKKMAADPDTHTYMLPFFHGMFPEDKWSEDMGKNFATARAIWLNKMSVSEGLRIYLYARMIRKGNPAGVVLMQSDVYRHYATHELPVLGIFQPGRVELAYKIAESANSGVWEEWDKMGVHIDPQLVREALDRVGFVAKNALWQTLGVLAYGLKSTADVAIGTTKQYPEYVVPAAAATASGAAILTWYRLDRSAAPHEVHNRLRGLVSSRQTSFKLVRGAKSISVGRDAAESAESIFSKYILESLQELTGAGDPMVREMGHTISRELHRCTTSSQVLSSTSTSWDTFASFVEKFGSQDAYVLKIAEGARRVADNADLANAMSLASRPRIGMTRRLGDLLIRRPALAFWEGAKQFPVEAFAPVTSDYLMSRYGEAGAGAAESVEEAADDLSKTKPADTAAPKAIASEASKAPEGDSLQKAGRTIAEGEAAADAAKEGTKGAIAGTEAADALKLRQVDSLLGNGDFQGLLRQAGIDSAEARKLLLAGQEFDADALIRISRDAGARKLLAGAMAVPQEARAKEVGRVLGLAKNSKVLIGMNIAGAGLDVFGFVMAANDFIANEGKIRDTQNEQLKAIYATARPVIIGEGATSFGGLVIGGIVIGTELAKGATIWTALAASSSWVMLPIGLAAMGARMTHERLVASAEYHTLNERELLPHSPGALLRDVNSTAEGQRLNYGQKFAEYFHLPDGGNYDVELANRGARDERYRAYFAQIAVRVVPQVTSLVLPFEDVQGKSNEQIQHAIQVRQKDEYRRFVANAMAYLRCQTSATFETVTPETLRHAQLYAQKCPAGKWGLTSDQKKEAEDLASNADKESTAETFQYMLSVASNPDRFQQELPVLCFQHLRHHLARAERRLLEGKGGYTGFNDSACNRARGFLADQLWQALHQFLQRTRTSVVRQEDIEGLMKSLNDLLEKAENHDTLALSANASKYSAFYQRIGADPYLLTVDGLAQYCDRYRFAKPETLGVSETDALPKETLDRYYGESMRLQKPVILKLQSGKDQGFLSVREAIWMRSSSNGTCTKVGVEGVGKLIALSPGYHQFWYEKSMPHVNDNQPVIASSMPAYSAQMSTARIRILSTPTSRPDFEIIVDEAVAEKRAA